MPKAARAAAERQRMASQSAMSPRLPPQTKIAAKDGLVPRPVRTQSAAWKAARAISPEASQNRDSTPVATGKARKARAARRPAQVARRDASVSRKGRQGHPRPLPKPMDRRESLLSRPGPPYCAGASASPSDPRGPRLWRSGQAARPVFGGETSARESPSSAAFPWSVRVMRAPRPRSDPPPYLPLSGPLRPLRPLRPDQRCQGSGSMRPA